MMLTAGRRSRSSRSLGLDQIIEPYYVLQDAGTEVVVVSLLGGDPPFRGSRIRSARAIAALERFRGDRRARDAISDTLTFAQIFPRTLTVAFASALWKGRLGAMTRWLPCAWSPRSLPQASPRRSFPVTSSSHKRPWRGF